MKKALFLFLILVAAMSAFAQNTQPQNFDLTKFGVRIEPDKRLIVVLASLEAAGVETPLTQKIQDLLAITKLLTVFDTFDNEGDALSSF